MQRIFSLTALVALAFAGTMTAQAVTLNPRGLGQVLLYPYYTVNKNQDTLISIGNASDNGEAVTVQFKEGINGRIVLDFNLYLSPHDVWTANVSQTSAAGGATLATSDHSCTYPVISPGGQPFLAWAYAGGSVYPSDGGPASIMRTREGSIDVFGLGDIIPGSPLEAAIEHHQTGIPGAGTPTCGAAISGSAPGPYLAAPTGGLFGAAAIADVGEGTFFAYNAAALTDFTAVLLFGGTLGPDEPDLRSANSAASAAGGAVAHLVADDGRVLSLDYRNGIDAVSAVFMAESLSNEYLVDTGLGANTDWIVAFPTRA